MSASLAGSDLEAAAGALRNGALALGLALEEPRREALLRYLELLSKWNRVYNLTAIRDAGRMVSVHLLDSLAVLPHIGARRILDVGSGGGLPGIPIAIARPELEVVLLDSSHKKAAFLQQARGTLGLANVEVICARVEEWQAPRLFDLIISRAFADLAEFVERSGHLLAPEGVFAAMKGVHPYDEIEALPARFEIRRVIPLAIPGLSAQRHLLLIGRR